MNAFATAAHLLTTSIRQHRWFLAVYLILTSAGALVPLLALGRELEAPTLTLLLLGQMVTLALLTAQVFLADPATDSRAQWRTRPVAWTALLAAQTGYVILMLWLPLLLFSLLGWWLGGFTLRQTALAGLELTLYVTGFTALTAGLAASSTQLWAFFARFVGLLIGTLAALWFANMSGWRTHLAASGAWALDRSSFVSLVFLALTAAGLSCLFAAYVVRNSNWRRAALALLILCPLWLPTRSTTEPLQALHLAASPPALRPLPTDGAALNPSSRLVLGNFAVEVPGENFMVTPLEADLLFEDRAGRRGTLSLRRRHTFDTEAETALHPGALEEQLAGLLPPGLRPVTPNTVGSHHLLTADLPKNLDTQAPGRLLGSVTYALVRWHFVGEAPLVPGLNLERDGHAVRFSTVTAYDSELAVELLSRSPHLLWSNRPNEQVGGRMRRPLSAWVLVLPQPARSQALWNVFRPYSTGGGLPFVKRGFGRVDLNLPASGLQADAQPPTVRVYRVVVEDLVHTEFDWPDHRLRTEFRTVGPVPSLVQGAGLQPAQTLPSTLADVKTVQALHAFPFDNENQRAVEEHSGAIFQEDLAEALDHVPWLQPQHRALLSVLSRTSLEDLPDNFSTALKVDPRLMEPVEQRRWGDTFREEIIAEVRRRNPFTPPAALRLVAGYDATEDLDADLSWHFLHNRYLDQTTLFPLLSARPGVDTQGLLREAWSRSILTGDWPDLIVPALEAGLTDALPRAVAFLHMEGMVDEPRQSRVLRALMAVTGRNVRAEDFYAWILANGGKLVFDPATTTYRIPAPEAPSERE